MRVISLASGSSGNALAIEHEGRALLVDCGCQPRRLSQLLREAAVGLGELVAVALTHEHTDHIAGLEAIPRELGIPLVMSPGTWAARPRLNGEPVFAGRPVIEQPVGSTRDVGPFQLTSFPVSHDGAEVCGYLIEAGGRRVAVFTDLGVAQPHLHEPLALAELVVIEANHDEQLLWRGPYPWPLKRRVALSGPHARSALPALRRACRDSDSFVRIHRSYLLNIERIEKIELYAKDSRVAILRDGSRLPVSRSGYARLKELL